MNTYTISFYGRNKGAIGVFHSITATVKAPDEKQAILKLYDNYDHVHLPIIAVVPAK